MDELKPCPFCGGKAELRGNEQMSWVSCTNCIADMEIMWSEEISVKSWNRRVGD